MVKNYKKNLFVLFLFLVIGLYAQNNLDYTYDNNDKVGLESYFKKITENQINSISGGYKSERKKIYNKQLESLKKQLEDSTFVFNQELTNRVKVVFDEIYRVNPELKDENFRFLFDKTMYPNAGAYGNGLFTINLGLFSLFDTEDEVAFVICHELAHYYLLHIHKKIDNYITVTHSKEIKHKARAIKRKKYGKNTAGLKLLRDLSFNLSEHSREAELEADSKGFEYFSKTKYNKEAARSALNRLGDLEELIFTHKVDWDLLFSTENYKFKKNLLQKEQSLFDSEEVIDDYKWDEDSLKSHPNTDLRVEKISNLLVDERELVETENYKEIKQLSQKIAILSAIDTNRLDYALYLVSSNYESNPFYKSCLGQILYKMYLLKKEHNLGKYISLESDLSDEVHLNEIRRFIHNVDLYELKKMGKAFTARNKEKLKENKTFIITYKLFNN